MCQIIGISDIRGLDKNQISALALCARKLMESQKSGFGFAYSTKSRKKKNHTYYVEKYVNPSQFKGIGTVGASKQYFRDLEGAINIPMLSSGHPDTPTGPMIIHGRTATNEVNLTNTHPFRKKGWAMVHNGVVEIDLEPEDFAPDKPEMDYLELLKSRYSSCDSEYLINSYAFGKGHHDWYDYIEGYAATMSIDPNNNLIIAKDDKAKLFISAIPKLNNALVFSTVASYPHKLAQAINMTATSAFEMEGERAIRIEPNGGAIKVEKFSAMNRVSISHSAVNRSLGYNASPSKKSWNSDSNTWVNGKKVKSYSKTEQGYFNSGFGK